jgi:hypothetical protein
MGADPVRREVAAQELAVERQAQVEDHRQVGPRRPAHAVAMR